MKRSELTQIALAIAAEMPMSDREWEFLAESISIKLGLSGEEREFFYRARKGFAS